MRFDTITSRVVKMKVNLIKHQISSAFMDSEILVVQKAS